MKGEVQKMEGKKLKVRTEQGNVGLYLPEDCPLQNPMSRMGVEVGQMAEHRQLKLFDATDMYTPSVANGARMRKSMYYAASWLCFPV